MSSADPVYLHALGIACAVGNSRAEVLSGLMAGSQAGMVRRTDLLPAERSVFVGQVDSDLPELSSKLTPFSSRNGRLLIAAAAQIDAEIRAEIARVGADRVAVVMGSSTSGIAEGEAAVAHLCRTGALPDGFDFRRQEMGSVAELLACHFDLAGPAYTISTACSSGAQAMASGRRLLRSGIADAVLVGGVDSLCRLTVGGFSALDALSHGICNPFSRNRDGTTIGEGAALFLMRREPSEIALLGVGSTSDAYSMNAPDPEGRGVERAAAAALANAGVMAADIGYVQLHGTGTRHNDAMESKAMLRIFDEDRTLFSSSKPQIGHTLGAAGALGAALCWLTLSPLNRQRMLPPHLFDGQTEDGMLARGLVRKGQTLEGGRRELVMANACAFGGNNISLVLGVVA